MQGSRSAADTSRSTRQRGDIQGLRAVAVLTVVAAHAGLGLEGGYVGVDVFFVISGFLISQQLFREAAGHGRISLLTFYARRARRILPAATAVLLVTLLASAALLNKLQTREASIDALWASLFTANIRFASVEMDYFAQDQATSPLQHYWSLAVEEQFYVIWPLLLMLAIAVGVRRYGVASVRQVGPLLITLTLASLAWSLWLTSQESPTAYFSTLARAWELGAGALVALYGPRLMRRADDGLRGLLRFTGLGAIAVACLEFTSLTLVPGWPALLPVLGSAMICLAGVEFARDGSEEVPGVAARLLSLPAMRWIGDRSYSLYLWHWPVLVIPGFYLGDDLGLAADLALAGLAVALAALTYTYVETPFRRPRAGRWRSVALYPVTVGLVASASWATVLWVQHELTPDGDNPAVTLVDYAPEAKPQPDPEPGPKESRGKAGPEPEPKPEPEPEPDPAEERKALVRASVLAARDGRGVPSTLRPDLLSVSDDVGDLSDCSYPADVEDLCTRGDEDAERTAVVLGDSHGRMWVPALDAFGEEEGWAVHPLVMSRCAPVDLPLRNRTDAEAEDCADFNAWVSQTLAELRPDLVVVAALPPVGVNNLSGVEDTGRAQEAVRTSYRDLFLRLRKDAGHTVLIADPPFLPTNPVECLTGDDVHLGTCLFEGNSDVRMLRDAQVTGAKRGGGSVIDPTSWFCWDGSCPSVVGATVSYRDRNHLTVTATAEVAPLVIHRLHEVLVAGR